MRKYLAIHVLLLGFIYSWSCTPISTYSVTTYPGHVNCIQKVTRVDFVDSLQWMTRVTCYDTLVAKSLATSYYLDPYSFRGNIVLDTVVKVETHYRQEALNRLADGMVQGEWWRVQKRAQSGWMTEDDLFFGDYGELTEYAYDTLGRLLDTLPEIAMQIWSRSFLPSMYDAVGEDIAWGTDSTRLHNVSYPQSTDPYFYSSQWGSPAGALRWLLYLSNSDVDPWEFWWSYNMSNELYLLSTLESQHSWTRTVAHRSSLWNADSGRLWIVPSLDRRSSCGTYTPKSIGTTMLVLVAAGEDSTIDSTLIQLTNAATPQTSVYDRVFAISSDKIWVRDFGITFAEMDSLQQGSLIPVVKPYRIDTLSITWPSYVVIPTSIRSYPYKYEKTLPNLIPYYDLLGRIMNGK